MAELERQKKEADDARERELEHQKWMAEQQKKLLEARVQKQLAMEMPSNNSGELLGSPYDPEGGFSIFFDYALGLSSKVQRAGLVYCFYDNGISKTQVRSLPHVDTDKDDDVHKRCLFSEHRHFRKVPPLATLYALMEVQHVVGLPMGPNHQPKVLASCCVSGASTHHG